jgi:hypothetical protein
VLLLLDLLRTADIELGRYKLHLATGGRDGPLRAYFDGEFESWQANQAQRNFRCDSVIGLIQLGGPEWLFAGVWRVTGTPQEVRHGARSRYVYPTEEIGAVEHLAGRVIVRFERTFRASYLWGERYADQLEVSRVLPERMTFMDFPGYANVRIAMPELRHIVSRQLPSWRAALAAVGGIYLITDTRNGRHYVGKASGGDGIWGRWSAYAGSLHGNNKELRELIAAAGREHFDAFHFAILEICDLQMSGSAVDARESHWKEVLGSRRFGYNAN